MESNIFNKFKKKISGKESSIEDDVTVELDLSEKTAILNLSEELKDQKKPVDLSNSHENIQHKSLFLKGLKKFLPGIYNKLNIGKKKNIPSSEVNEKGGPKKTQIKVIHIIIALGIGFMAIEGYIFEEDTIATDEKVKKVQTPVTKKDATSEDKLSSAKDRSKLADTQVAGVDESEVKPEIAPEIKPTETQTSDVFNLESELETLKKKEVENKALPAVEDKPVVVAQKSERLSDMFEKDDLATNDKKEVEENFEESLDGASEDTVPEDTVSEDDTQKISANNPQRAIKAQESINVEIVDDQLTDDVMSDLTDNSSFSENVLEKLEKKLAAKKEEDYSAPAMVMDEELTVDYAMNGRALVYNCSGGHWACVNTKVYSECVRGHKLEVESSSTKTCVPKLIYDNDIDCENVQQYNVSHGVDVDFCS